MTCADAYLPPFSWTANDYSNTWDPATLRTVEDDEIPGLINAESLADMKGVVHIPICSLTELIDYLNEIPEEDEEEIENANHPCPP